MRSEAAGALAVLAGVIVVFLLGWAIQGCSDGRDLVTLDAAPAALVSPGCDPPDAAPLAPDTGELCGNEHGIGACP